MKKIILYAGLFFCFSLSAHAQHFIGLDKDETHQLARKSGFYPDNLTVNQRFNYLKFVNSAETKTLIVFFDNEDVATHTRTVCDYSEYDFIIDDFNQDFERKSKNLWKYNMNNQVFEVSLEEKEWYFVVRTKKSG
jgi:hypothetical protein